MSAPAAAVVPIVSGTLSILSPLASLSLWPHFSRYPGHCVCVSCVTPRDQGQGGPGLGLMPLSPSPSQPVIDARAF